MEIRVLRGAEVRQLLPMAECIDLMQRTMIAVSEGRVVLPLRSILAMPGDRGMMGMMPGYLADPECFGVKLVSLIPRNKPPQYSSHLGLVLLFEAEHGQPVALLDAAEITAIRTAAASGWPPGCWRRSGPQIWRCWAPASRPAAILRPCWRFVRYGAFGCGRATGPKRSCSRILKVRSIAVVIETCATVREAIAGADIICTTTKAREPILEGDWLTPGVHLNVVGSSIAAAAEIDIPAVVKTRFFVDCRNSTINEGGEYLRALRAGAITPEHILGEIGEVANGSKAGRCSPLDMTLYKSLGIAPQDLASAHHVLEKARAAGVGQVVDF